MRRLVVVLADGAETRHAVPDNWKGPVPCQEAPGMTEIAPCVFVASGAILSLDYSKED
jgi:hypothetical protein